MLDALFSMGQAFESGPGSGATTTNASENVAPASEEDRMLLALFRMAADGAHLGGESAESALVAQSVAMAPPNPPEEPTEARAPVPAIDPAVAAELYRIRLEGAAEGVDSMRWGWAWRWKKRVTSVVRPTLGQAIDLLHAGLGKEVGPLFRDRAEEAAQDGDDALAAVLKALHARHEDPRSNPMHASARHDEPLEGESLDRMRYVGRIEGYEHAIRSICEHAPWRGWFLRTRPRAVLGVLEAAGKRVRSGNVGAAARLLEERRKSTPEVAAAFAQLVESPLYAAYERSIAIGGGDDPEG